MPTAESWTALPALPPALPPAEADPTAAAGGLGRAPILLVGYGNPSRGDDALGPLVLERVAARLSAQVRTGEIELLTDFQLQVEHVLDLAQRSRVVFVDASVSCGAPFEWTPLAPVRDASYSSHFMSPAALLQAYSDVMEEAPPPCYVLGIRGYEFELGRPLTAAASVNLEAALEFLIDWIAVPRRDHDKSSRSGSQSSS